jgi:hypothetical protein
MLVIRGTVVVTCKVDNCTEKMLNIVSHHLYLHSVRKFVCRSLEKLQKKEIVTFDVEALLQIL